MTDQMTVVVCAPDNGFSHSSPDVQGLKDGLADMLGSAAVKFCAVDEDGAALSSELSRIRDNFDGDIVIVPTTPFADDMQKRLIPGVLSERKTEAGRTLLARDAGVDPAMLRAAQARVHEALVGDVSAVVPQDSLLLIVGHGSIDTDANGNLMKMTRMIWEGLGFGWAEVAYVNGAFPLIEQSLARVGRLGFKSIVVLPYVIIGDHTVDGIPERVAKALDGAQSPQILYARSLGAEENVIQTLAERVREAVAGNAKSVMNCQLCTYREQVLAIEAHDHPHHDHAHDD